MSRVQPSIICSVFFSFFLLISAALLALDPAKQISQYRVQVWNMSGGLPGNSIFAIRQTPDGYLWLGTQDGLVRFDGLRFRSFDNRNTPQLKDNMIRALCTDRNGSLWIGTSSGGLNRYRQGKFSHYPVNRHKSLYKISAIEEDRWGNLWIGSISEGLTRLNPAGETFTIYNTGQGLPHHQVRFIHKDGKGDLWVTTAAGIVKLLQPGKFLVYAPQDRLPYFKTVSLYEEETDALWIGTGGSGLFRLLNQRFIPYGAGTGLADLTITYLFRDRMKSLWIGTDGDGLSRLRNGALDTISGGDGLTDGFIYSIYEDREGSLWLGTLDKGLYQLRDSKFTTYSVAEGLVDDYVNCVCKDRAGDLLIGTRAGVSKLRPTDGSLTTVLTPRQGLLDGNVLTLFEDSSGSLWIGTPAGLHRYKDGRLTSFTTRDGLAQDWITCIHGDSRGQIWIGTGSGLNRFTGSVFVTEEGFAGNPINFIFEDRGEALWIGTGTGLSRINEGRITACHARTESGDNQIQCMYQDNRGVFWLGSKRGLIRMNLMPEKANANPVISTSHYTVQHGLHDNDVSSILEDEKGYLWLGGRNGVSGVRKNQLERFSGGDITRIQPDSYNEKDGMKSRWCTGSGCKTRDGRFWFPTSAGVAAIDPHHIPMSRILPQPVIEKIVVDGETIKIRDYSRNSLNLPPGKKRLEFYYTAVSFINPSRIKFRLMLAGYDRDWLDMGTSRSTTYTRLSPGHYTFKVAACNPDGIWNEKESAFSFHMKPYWYRTWWAFLLYALGAFLGIFFFIKWRSARLIKEKRRLERIVKERTGEIREKSRQLFDQSEKLKEMDRIKSRFFASISHEFRTPLTLIMGPLEQRLSGSRDRQDKRELSMMLRNSRRLLGLINQLLDLSKLDSGAMGLQASRQNIVPFLKGIVHSFDSLVCQKDLALTVHTPQDSIVLYYDADKLEKVVCNLLFNAVKFTPPGGKISVTLSIIPEPDPGILEITVRDTGIGIPSGQMEQIFDRFYQVEGTGPYSHQGTGIGLALAKELVLLHHGEITANSAEGEGSEFIIRLPMGEAHLAAREIADVTGTAAKRTETAKVAEDQAVSPDDDEYSPDPDQVEFPDNIPVAEPGDQGEVQEKDLILVVEDSDDVREYIRGALEPLYGVAEARDGTEGIEKAKRIIPDLIISDIMMPGKDGYEVCKEIKSQVSTSHIPVILLTARAAEENIIRGLETGADDYITKPFSTGILLARIKNLIDLRRQFQENMQRDLTLQPVKITVSSRDEAFIKELNQAIEQDLSDPDLNVEELVKSLYMSHTTLYRKVHALTGESPVEYIRSYRLKRAAELLRADFGSVTDVAFEVGFSSAAYFTKCFREKFLQLPSAFKESAGTSS